jgi:hypothetical protein
MLLDKGANLEAKNEVSLPPYLNKWMKRYQLNMSISICAYQADGCVIVCMHVHIVLLHVSVSGGWYHPSRGVSLSLCVSVSDSMIGQLFTTPLCLVMWKW